MKKIICSAIFGFIILGSAIAVYAQDENDSKDKIKSKSGTTDEIIIKRKGDKSGKVTIEFKDDEVLVNGKPLSEFEDENFSVSKNRMSYWDGNARTFITPHSPFTSESWNGENFLLSEHAFLGVVTEKGEKGSKGVKISNITENSPAEKAGLKKGDVILRIDDTPIETFNELSKIISKHKADDKVTITYLRGNKEEKTTATLANHSMNFSYAMPRIQAVPKIPEFNFDTDGMGGYSYSLGRQHFGIKAQDTEDGKGVKVLEVSDESAADKAGLKEGDIITEFDGKAVNSADELAKIARDSKDKPSVSVKFSRDGKSETAELKIPKKLKTANL